MLNIIIITSLLAGFTLGFSAHYVFNTAFEFETKEQKRLNEFWRRMFRKNMKKTKTPMEYGSVDHFNLMLALTNGEITKEVYDQKFLSQKSVR